MVSRTFRSVISTTTAINTVPTGINTSIAIKATLRIVKFVTIIRIVTCLTIIHIVTCIAIIRIVTCIAIIRTLTAAKDNAFHNCFARCVASLVTTTSLNTIAISHDPTAAVNITYTAAVTAPISHAFDRIDVVPYASIIIADTLTIANPYKTSIVLETVKVLKDTTTTIAVTVTAIRSS